MDKVQIVVRSNEFSKVKNLKIGDNGEGLSVSREESERIGMFKSRRFYKSILKFFICHKIDHFKRNFSRREDNEYFVQIIVASDENGYKSVNTLAVSSLEIEKKWVMDSRFNYHM